MNITRVVRDVECEIKDYKDVNISLFDKHNDLLDYMEEQIIYYVPDDLKMKLTGEEYHKAKEDAIDYALKNLRQSGVRDASYVEDMLCYFYDRIEDIDEDKDDYSTEYLKVYTDKVGKVLLTNFMTSNQIEYDMGDPLDFAVEEAVYNAMSRSVEGEDSIKLDAYMQLDSAINESDIFDVYFEKAIRKLEGDVDNGK